MESVTLPYGSAWRLEDCNRKRKMHALHDLVNGSLHFNCMAYIEYRAVLLILIQTAEGVVNVKKHGVELVYLFIS